MMMMTIDYVDNDGDEDDDDDHDDDENDAGLGTRVCFAILRCFLLFVAYRECDIGTNFLEGTKVSPKVVGCPPKAPHHLFTTLRLPASGGRREFVQLSLHSYLIL